MGPPIPGALAAVKELGARYQLVILTARPPGNDKWQHVHDWLRHFGFPALPVTNIKPAAVAYIDDHGLHFDGNWTRALSDLRRLEPWLRHP